MSLKSQGNPGKSREIQTLEIAGNRWICFSLGMRIDVSVTREVNESYELGKYKKTLCTVSIMLVQYKTKDMCVGVEIVHKDGRTSGDIPLVLLGKRDSTKFRWRNYDAYQRLHVTIHTLPWFGFGKVGLGFGLNLG